MAHESAAGSFQYSKGPPVSIKDLEVLYRVSDYQVLKDDSAAWC
jgi:hypothetical protein